MSICGQVEVFPVQGANSVQKLPQPRGRGQPQSSSAVREQQHSTHRKYSLTPGSASSSFFPPLIHLGGTHIISSLWFFFPCWLGTTHKSSYLPNQHQGSPSIPGELHRHPGSIHMDVYRRTDSQRSNRSTESLKKKYFRLPQIALKSVNTC